MKRSFLFTLLVSLITGVHAQGVWTQKASYGGGGVTEARAFAIGNYGYIGGALQTFWEYDPVNDTWTQVANFPATPRGSAAAFAIGTKGYIGTGGNYNDFYEYDQPTNTWSQKANFGGSAREGAVGIAINGKGYIGTGGSYLNDWWEYDPVADTWTQKANLAGPTRYHAGAFAISNKGYVCTGFNGSFFNDLLEYDPATNAWTAKAPLPGATRDRPVGIGAGGKGYIVTGWTGSSALSDAWEYDPVTDSWTQLPAFPGVPRYNACGFGIGNKIYVGTGSNGSDTFYEFGPSCTVQANAVPSTCFSSCDGSAGVAFPSGSATYQWSNGSTSASITGLCPGNYTVFVTDSINCTATATVTVTSPPAITGSAVITQPVCFGDMNGGACFFPAGGTPPYSGYQWAIGNTTSCISNVPAGLYTVTVTDASGCTGVNNVVITQPGPVTLTMNGVNASCQTCANGSATAAISGGVPPFTYQWSNGSTSAFIIGLLPGVYSFCATDSNGCQQCDSVVISFSSGIGTPEPLTASITPNPFSSSIQITLHSAASLPATLSVFDITGKRIETHQLPQSEFQLHADHYPAGIYFIEIQSRETVYRTKLLKR